MIKRKRIRDKGKIKLSRYFQNLDIGDRVAVLRELSLQPRFPKRIHGRTGVVEGMRGRGYIVKIKDLNKEKSYIIHPVHLKKIEENVIEKK